MKTPAYPRMKIDARLLILCTVVVLAGCGQSDRSSDSRASTPTANASDASQSRTRERIGTARDDVQVGNEITRHVADYMLLLEGTNVIHDMLGRTNQPIALTEEHVRQLRMAAYAAVRAQDYTQCVALAAALLRCTNLPSYVGSSVHLLAAQALQHVGGLAAAVPYYEYVLEYWQGLSAPR